MLQNFIALFFPKVCSGCQIVLLGDEKVICTLCRHEIPLTLHHLNPENEAFRKFYGRIPLEHASSLMYFHKKGIVQNIIHSLKYKGHEEIGEVLGQWYAGDLKTLGVLKTAEAIIPVPLHKKRRKERGYNQVDAFGKKLAENLLIPFNDKILIKKTYSKTQSKKNFNERTMMAEDAYHVDFDESHHNTHFLLIDDVLTTGTTLENCARAILKIPGAKISIVTMAMTN